MRTVLRLLDYILASLSKLRSEAGVRRLSTFEGPSMLSVGGKGFYEVSLYRGALSQPALPPLVFSQDRRKHEDTMALVA